MTLHDFFTCNNKCAIAFSGGVDSAYLLYAAISENADVKAYYVKSAFQPQFELDDAIRLADSLHADLKVIDLDILRYDIVVVNTKDRCYHCKTAIFSAIQKEAEKDGYNILLDGTNASDDIDDRPGMRALIELSVTSPLRECGLTKDDVRRLSKKAGLFTWDKPSYACLATRIPTGTVITEEMLNKTEKAEDYLMRLGFSDFRIRLLNNLAKIQINENQIVLLCKEREKIVIELKKYYDGVLLDLEVRNERHS